MTLTTQITLLGVLVAAATCGCSTSKPLDFRTAKADNRQEVAVREPYPKQLRELNAVFPWREDHVDGSTGVNADNRQVVPTTVPKTDPIAAEKAEKLAYRGKRQYEGGLLDSAQRTLEQAVQIDPWNNKAWYYLHRVQDSLREQKRIEQRLRDILRRSETI